MKKREIYFLFIMLSYIICLVGIIYSLCVMISKSVWLFILLVVSIILLRIITIVGDKLHERLTKKD
jgi:fatty acid desaturase